MRHQDATNTKQIYQPFGFSLTLYFPKGREIFSLLFWCHTKLAKNQSKKTNQTNQISILTRNGFQPIDCYQLNRNIMISFNSMQSAIKQNLLCTHLAKASCLENATHFDDRKNQKTGHQISQNDNLFIKQIFIHGIENEIWCVCKFIVKL